MKRHFAFYHYQFLGHFGLKKKKRQKSVLYISYHSTFHHCLSFLSMLRGDIKPLLGFRATNFLYNKWRQVDK